MVICNCIIAQLFLCQLFCYNYAWFAMYALIIKCTNNAAVATTHTTSFDVKIKTQYNNNNKKRGDWTENPTI